MANAAKKFVEHASLDLQQTNEEILKRWNETDMFRRSIDEKEGCPQFVFFEGPPSANGHPGIHHVLARSIKDTFNRYKTMKGYQVHRKAGWDTHGLPVELGVEKELGITKSGVTYTDLTSTNVVHALKLPWIILPNALALIATIAAVLIDFGVFGIEVASEKFALTLMGVSFLSLAIMIVPIAIMMDNTRNMVISRDSNINANYNRAKKKTWADLFIAMSWANSLFLIAYSVLMVYTNSEAAMLDGILVYTALLMVIAALGVITQKRVEERYARDTELELTDDDDNWILGMFYYNKNDTRLNVEKRLGYGATINLAHPAGKVIGIVSALILIGSLIMIIYLNVTGQLVV